MTPVPTVPKPTTATRIGLWSCIITPFVKVHAAGSARPPVTRYNVWPQLPRLSITKR
jgi:hypothetical protein